MRLAGLLVGLVAVTVTACTTATPADDTAEASGLQIATTVAPITSIVANIAGDEASITGIVPEGTNSHTFEPPPSASELLATVDVLFMNGLDLEDPTEQLAEANLSADAELVKLGNRVLDEDEYLYDFSFPEEEGKPNPHTWTDPRYVIAYAEVATDVLAERDPDNADTYRDNLAAYTEQVEEFDVAMREAFTTIPDADKRLLTYHDSFAYFAQDYEGWEVVGAIQVADFSDPSPRRVAELIEQIRDQDVPAIFGSEVFPSPVLEQIANETGAQYVAELRDDDLPGEPGDPEHSLLGLLRFDFVTITEALGGDASALEAYELRDVDADGAEYPQ
jgi:ABC-type Zn uptake system ZnuABC Zn-binding protein ZnuA